MPFYLELKRERERKTWTFTTLTVSARLTVDDQSRSQAKRTERPKPLWPGETERIYSPVLIVRGMVTEPIARGSTPVAESVVYTLGTRPCSHGLKAARQFAPSQK